MGHFQLILERGARNYGYGPWPTPIAMALPLHRLPPSPVGAHESNEQQATQNPYWKKKKKNENGNGEFYNDATFL